MTNDLTFCSTSRPPSTFTAELPSVFKNSIQDTTMAIAIACVRGLRATNMSYI
jgi:hypothetical protein